MTREEAIKIFNTLLLFGRYDCPKEEIEECFNMAIKALEQEPCEDEYIKVPKKALKYRTAGMVAYNAEWLKNHFDIERAVICGEQELCEDAISRQAVDELSKELVHTTRNKADFLCNFWEGLQKLPPVTPQPKTGHCKDCNYFEYDSITKVNGVKLIFAHEICSKWGDGCKTKEDGYCFMFEPQESEDKE